MQLLMTPVKYWKNDPLNNLSILTGMMSLNDPLLFLESK